MILLAATLGGLSSLIGLFIGYSFNIAAGSAIVLTAANLFLIGFFLSPKKVEQTKTKQRIFTVIAVMALIGMGMFSYQRFLRPDDNAAENKLTVVATNSIIADMVKEVAGDKVNLHSIVPVGKNPHEYEPLPVDVRNTQEADVILIR